MKWKVAAIVIIAVIIVTAIIFSVVKTTKSQATSNVPIFYQTTGAFRSVNQWNYPNSYMLPSSDVKIREYEFKSEMKSFDCKYSEYHCEENTCSGTDSGKRDEHGCMIYEYDASSRSCGDTNNAGCRASNCGGSWGCSVVGGSDPCSNAGYTLIGYYPSHCANVVKNTPAGECGGWHRDTIYCENGCWLSVKIYKDGVEIADIPPNPGNTYDYSIGGIKARLFVASDYYQASCIWIGSTFSYNETEDKFSVDSKVEQNILTVEVNNDFDDVYGNFTVFFNYSLEINGQLREYALQENQIVDVLKGKNTYTFNIPTDATYKNTLVKANFDVLMDTADFTGLNGICYERAIKGSSYIKPFSECDYIMVYHYESGATSINKSCNCLDNQICKEGACVNDCSLSGCQDGYVCKAGQCEKEKSYTAWIISAIAAVSIGGSLLFFRKKR